MKKKFYIQPLTGLTRMLTGNVLNLTSNFVDNSPNNGIRDGAPMRQFSGETQGLKYLI